MKTKSLPIKKAMKAILLILLMAAVGKVNAQTYTYSPAMQTYTDCGSGTTTDWALNYSSCSLGEGSATYQNGQVHAAIWTRNSSTGTMTFRVAKCSGYFQNGNSGKVLIIDHYWGDVYCTPFTIYNSTTPHVTATISNYGNFTGSRTFSVILITSNQQNKFFAGYITIQSGSAPVSHVYDPTDVTSTSATFQGCVNPNGSATTYTFNYGTSSTNLNMAAPAQTLPAGTSCVSVSASISNLNPETTYYYRIAAQNNVGAQFSTNLISFTTLSDGSAPTVTTLSATNTTSNSARLQGRVNPQGRTTYYYFKYGTSSNNYSNQTITSTLPGDYENHTVYVDVSGLIPNTTYYFRCYAYNDKGDDYGTQKSFTTNQDNCYFPDCPAGELDTASRYLCQRGIIEGINGNLEPNNNITRAQLAKASFFGLYSNSTGVNIPNPLVTDYFPCIYPDLQENSYYYQAAKALLYLEYGDGISPFDRDKSCFNPTGTITRRLVLKVLLETFNIAPATSGTNPFSDFPSTEDFWGYAKKAYDLGITQNTTFRPYDLCTRGEAFLFLYRILQLIDNNTISAPNPVNTESPATSSFFIPANLSPKVVNAIRGVEYGNFNYYNKDFFEIPGYMDLSFGIDYNSYLTEMPDEFYPVRPLGKAWTHTYDMYMNIVTDAYNNTSNYVFHMQNGLLLIYNNNLSPVTEGNYYDLSTSGSNKYILKSRDQISYTFERQSTSDGIYYLTQIKDRNDNAISISYSYGNSHYRITSVSTLGRTLNFYYTSGTDLLYYVKDPINRKVYFYYTDGQLTSIKDAKNQTSYFTYGTLDIDKGLLKSIQLPKGNHVYNNYQQRKLVSMRRVNNSNSYTHDSIYITPNYQNGSMSSKVITKLNGSQSVTTNYTMNSKSRITRMTSGSHTDVSYEYNISDKPDLVSKVTDNKANVQTSYAYNNKGLPTSVTVSVGGETHNTQTTYTNLNDVNQFTDARGNTTTYYYDNGSVNLTRVVDALGKTTYFVNNSYGKPTQVTDPSGTVTNYVYNSYGNETSMNIPSISMYFDRTYDGVSRVTSAKTSCDCQTTTYTYDNNDNMLTETDALSHTTSYTYDANDNVTQITDANGHSTNFTYDDNDFLSSISYQGATKNYTYNRDGSIASYTDPNGYTFNYSYNSSGEMTSDGYASYSYNSKGQLTSVTKDSKAITYSYDAFGRVSSIAYDGKTVSYTYDNNDNVLTITYPGSKTVTYTYDALNRMTSVKDWNNNTTTYNYRDDGQLNYYQYPNSLRTTFAYDAGGRVVSQTTKRSSGSGTVVASYNYTWDEFGNHTQETFTEPYESYPSIPTSTTNYTYYNNTNRLQSAGSLSFGYDNNGNTISRTGRTYGYDVKNNLTAVSGDFSASYTYDGLGNRRTATRYDVTRKYVLDLLGDMSNVLMETDASGNAVCYYIYGATGLVSRIDANNNTRYYVYDYRGSTVAMTDATTSANITHKYQYDDFGKLLQSEEADTNPFCYVGGYGVMHEDDALTFMRARYYDPEVGRFLSEDPIWNTNLYPYTENNPIVYVDPKGDIQISPEALQTLNKLIKWIKIASTAKGSKDLIIHFENGDDKWVQDFIGLINGTFGLYSKIWYKLEGSNGSLHIFQKGANIGWKKTVFYNGYSESR
jgi:RHS repeat-associated protein